VPASAPPRGTPKSAPPEELTTMAIALRAAEARARAKREKPGS
jgi:hypothetical protein